ncbi:MAG: hypothetical protein U1F11_13720 [Steroidobacteraceae bacterium]
MIARGEIVLCGTAWFDETFRQLDPAVQVEWAAADGARVAAGATLCTLRGRARPILSGERTALNFLQTLSGTPRPPAATSPRWPARAAASSTRARRCPGCGSRRSTPCAWAARSTTGSACTT